MPATRPHPRSGFQRSTFSGGQDGISRHQRGQGNEGWRGRDRSRQAGDKVPAARARPVGITGAVPHDRAQLGNQLHTRPASEDHALTSNIDLHPL